MSPAGERGGREGSRKTPTTAVVLIPPEAVWEPIQEIRRRRDRHVDRWMPHVTLLYPFRPPDAFPVTIAALEAARRDLAPFDLALARPRFFDHGGSFTVWLEPEPKEPLVALQQALLAAAPGCDDVNRYESGFTPHLSVGQARSREELDEFLAELASWAPLRFLADSAALIRRGRDTGDVFVVERAFPLGG